MKETVALVIVFNHRYDKNIPVLERIYEGRFPHVYFLVPFYEGEKENVIPVYESSFRFQGYFAQGFRQYFAESHAHYLFVADDLLLNPSINEDNYKAHFGLDNTSSFIPEIHSLHKLANNDTLRFLPSHKDGQTKWYWWRLKQLIHFRPENEGIETKSELPSYEEAEQKLKAQGYDLQPLSVEDVFGSWATHSDRPSLKSKAKFFLKSVVYRSGFKLPYPVVGAYSDIVIVDKSSVKNFIHYCGVFAANGLFVEFAVPTALLLACNKVVTEPTLGKRGLIYWSYTKEEEQAYRAALQPYGNNLLSLLKNFPKDKLYLHPIKLSKWNCATRKEPLL